MNSPLPTVLQGIAYAAILGSSALMMFAPHRWRTERSVKRERALADRLARGHDSYFEELRTLQASRPLGPRTVRIFGAGLFLLSAALLTMLFFKP